MSEAIIKARGLTKNYAAVKALKGVDLDFFPGEVVCVIGPNGAGKTTLLHLLAGALFPTRGEVSVFGMDRWKQNFEIRQRSITLPTEPVFGTSRTPYEYLRFLGQIYGIPKEAFLAKLEVLSEAMQYFQYLRRELMGLSVGLSKKAGIIGCFLPEVPLRILDEPFAGGVDPLGMEVLYSWFDEARKRNETIIFSTQVLDQAENIADRLILLQEGLITAIGSPRELIAKAGIAPGTERPLAKAFLALTSPKGNGDRNV